MRPNSKHYFIWLVGLFLVLPLLLARGNTQVSTATPQSAKTLPNIIFVMVDALRSDHVSAYGYSRLTTPNLDAWVANQGVLFQNAISTSAWTFPAVAAIMTGRDPSRLGASWTNDILSTDATTLAEYLQGVGYYTAGFSAATYVRGNRGFVQGFNIYDDSLSYNHPTSAQEVAGEINALAMNWLNSWPTRTQPLFLFMYYIDPHTWYNPPPPYDTMYDSTYTGTLTATVYRDGQDVVGGIITPTLRDVEHLLALYDGEITYWDAQFGQMMTYLHNQQLLSNTLIILTSDHGEMFGEHGKWVHTNGLYEEVLRVPLAMRYTGTISAGLAVTTPVQNMDIMPTILDWAGLTIPAMQATSLRALSEGHSAPPRDVFSEIEGANPNDVVFYWIAPHQDLRSIQRGGWKLIHYVGNPELDELYLLNPNSIYETDNLIQNRPDLAESLRQAVLDWFDIAYQNYLPYVLKTQEE